MRAFISIELTQNVRSSLTEIQREFKKVNSRVRWIKAESLHLTLSFLGSINEEQVNEISSFLLKLTQERSTFELDVRGLGYFGHQRKPTAVWAGLKDSAELMSLQAEITEGLRSLGLELEPCEFLPHITLSRVKESKGLSSLVDKIQAKKDLSFGALYVDRVNLVQSVITHSGATYSVLGEFLLR